LRESLATTPKDWQILAPKELENAGSLDSKQANEMRKANAMASDLHLFVQIESRN